MFSLAILFGGLVGLALGLTGAGGGIFAVPLLVHGMAIAPREAIGISLASVGGTALFGVAPRLVRGEIELRTGILFAIAGMLAAPIGSYVSGLLPGNLLLVLFGLLMLVVAWRMWPRPRTSELPGDGCGDNSTDTGKSACKRGQDGKLHLTSRCAMQLALLGLTIGVVSGMFGVGGGFMIVPALVLFSGMKIQNAISTSLLVIFLVSMSGVASYIALGNQLSFATTLQFLIGGFVGMWAGGMFARRLRGPTLQRVFAAAVILVALFVVTKSIIS